MAQDDLKEAIAANLDWIRRIRLADTIEWVWLGVPAALGIVLLAVCLAFTNAEPYAVTGSAAHLTLELCLYFAAPRHWLLLLSLLVFISELNLLIYIWNSAPKLESVLLTYGAIAAIALLVSAAAYRRAVARLALLNGASHKDDFRWLVTSAPPILRHRARAVVNSVNEWGI